MVLAPLAVAAAGGGRGAGGLGASAVDLPALVVGLLVVGTLALGTRAMHLDGLADTVDGLGSGWDRQRALEVMRRGDIGPMGVVALVIMLGLQADRDRLAGRRPARRHAGRSWWSAVPGRR